MNSEPDYQAAARAIDDEIGPELREHLGHIMRKWPNTIQQLAELAVDAAIGKRRLVSPTALVIQRDENGEWPEWARQSLSMAWKVHPAWPQIGDTLDSLASSQGEGET